jgi:plastocyanin
MAFDPTTVTVHRGDTVRFVQAGNLPHNVEFKSVPQRTDLGVSRIGRDLKASGETYSIVIDQRFAAGKHVYVFTSHEVLGMAGIIYVADESK